MPLPDPGEPLRLADGRLVYPGGRNLRPDREDEFVEVPTQREAQRIVTQTRRKLSELPEVPRTMNTVGVVLSYTLFGLADDEIAIATGLTLDQIGRIKMSDPFTQMHDAVVRSVLDAETGVVRDLLQRKAYDAAQTMVAALAEGTRADRITAARDILDRSGHRAADVVEHRHRMDGGLVIEIVRRDTTAVPTIDMEVP